MGSDLANEKATIPYLSFSHHKLL